MDTLIAEPADAPNLAIASGLQSVHRWRGAGDPCRSASRAHIVDREIFRCCSSFAALAALA